MVGGAGRGGNAESTVQVYHSPHMAEIRKSSQASRALEGPDGRCLQMQQQDPTSLALPPEAPSASTQNTLLVYGVTLSCLKIAGMVRAV